jgi:hypothetical protein
MRRTLLSRSSITEDCRDACTKQVPNLSPNSSTNNSVPIRYSHLASVIKTYTYYPFALISPFSGTNTAAKRCADSSPYVSNVLLMHTRATGALRKHRIVAEWQTGLHNPCACTQPLFTQFPHLQSEQDGGGARLGEAKKQTYCDYAQTMCSPQEGQVA